MTSGLEEMKPKSSEKRKPRAKPNTLMSRMAMAMNIVLILPRMQMSMVSSMVSMVSSTSSCKPKYRQTNAVAACASANAIITDVSFRPEFRAQI